MLLVGFELGFDQLGLTSLPDGSGGCDVADVSLTAGGLLDPFEQPRNSFEQLQHPPPSGLLERISLRDPSFHCNYYYR